VSQHEAPRLADTSTTLAALGPRILAVAGGLGIVALGGALVLGAGEGDGWRRFLYAYLTSYAFFLSISLGALVFLPLQYLTRSSWSVVLRRLVEVMAANLPLMALLSLPLILNLDVLYDWAGGEVHGAEAELLAHKLPFLNPTSFLIRWAAYFVIWTAMAFYFWRTSLRQDGNEDPRSTLGMENRAGFALVVCALTVTLAAIDLLMTLDFAWFSTIFGVYYWAGGFVSFFAMLTLVTLGLQRSGRMERIISMEHFHDYGKAMFAFTFFWAYIAFSQFMLYWYANIPEETAWFLVRIENGWEKIGLGLIFGTFLLPFLGLISRFAKRSRKLLAFWATWIIVFQWLNIFWVTMPEYSPTAVTLGPLDILCFFGIGGLWLAGLALLAQGRSLVPTGDPRLQDSLEFENA